MDTFRLTVQSVWQRSEKGHLIVKESDRISYDPSEIVDFRTGKKREN